MLEKLRQLKENLSPRFQDALPYLGLALIVVLMFCVF